MLFYTVINIITKLIKLLLLFIINYKLSSSLNYFKTKKKYINKNNVNTNLLFCDAKSII